MAYIFPIIPKQTAVFKNEWYVTFPGVLNEIGHDSRTTSMAEGNKNMVGIKSHNYHKRQDEKKKMMARR